MKYLKKYNEHKKEGKNIPIFSQDWKKLLPKKLKIITSNGEYELEKKDLLINGTGDLMEIAYFQQTFDEPDEVLDDGEPDYLEFDICFTKHQESGDIRMLVDISYGDAMMFEFTIDPPNKITVAHYNGIGSKYDPDTKFAFTNTSLKKLVEFFNKFTHGLKLSVDDFKFLDKDDDSYKFDNSVQSVSANPEYNGKGEEVSSFKSKQVKESLDKQAMLGMITGCKPPALIQIPDGEYKGSIKGYDVYMESIDSGFRATSGYRNMFPIKCTVYIKNGTGVAFSKAGVLFSDKQTEENWKKEFGSGMSGMETDPRMKQYL